VWQAANEQPFGDSDLFGKVDAGLPSEIGAWLVALLVALLEHHSCKHSCPCYY
jgi:hypothetical protein